MTKLNVGRLVVVEMKLDVRVKLKKNPSIMLMFSTLTCCRVNCFIRLLVTIAKGDACELVGDNKVSNFMFFRVSVYKSYLFDM